MGEEAQGKDGAMGLGCRTVAPGICVCGVRGDSYGGTAESTPAVAELAVMCVLDPPHPRPGQLAQGHGSKPLVGRARAAVTGEECAQISGKGGGSPSGSELHFRELCSN